MFESSPLRAAALRLLAAIPYPAREAHVSERYCSVSGPPWHDVAASAYRAYAASTGNRNFRGDPMPAWEDLPAPIRVAWEAAARQVGECIVGGAVPVESRWAGWLPPPDRF